ncbi:site-2 protease family protein [bacterium]|nr:site-2 protease family protein [candidate division CSSED10-310 bacterium]
MTHPYFNRTSTMHPQPEQGIPLAGYPSGRAQPSQPENHRLPIILFIATIFSTLWAGCLHMGINVFERPWLIYHGFPFSFTLLLILGVHELGHSIMCGFHGIPATVPYFIPMPNFLGTMGAFIRIKQTITRRRALLDVGMAGPLAGFVVALPATVIGYWLSAQPVRVPDGDGLVLGQSILTWILEYFIFPDPRPGMTFVLHPVAFAGYIGLFVTAMNLLPVGQLDGSHIASAMFGRRQWIIARLTVGMLFIAGFSWNGWWFWAILLVIFGTRHAVIQHDARPLHPIRRLLGWVTFGILVITFVPAPFSFTAFTP